MATNFFFKERERTLWASLNEKELARQYLLKRQLPEDYVERILSIGDSSCCPESLPLDFLLAATHGKIVSKGFTPDRK